MSSSLYKCKQAKKLLCNNLVIIRFTVGAGLTRHDFPNLSQRMIAAWLQRGASGGRASEDCVAVDGEGNDPALRP